MVQVANPIYDIVFKYLMEDERIAKIIISALLKKKVLEVHQRRNEYSNITRDSLSVFRIDFGATVVEDDGTEHLVLIELQKTWLETETLRFRQYLAAHYSNPENINEKEGDGSAIPMVAVYLLGHKVGDIEEPILYVKPTPHDYDGNIVTEGLPNTFVDSLTHESIIVQIPRLHGHVSNRLEQVLNVFDQSRRESNHILNINEVDYTGDEEMQCIISRLISAAADAKMRHEMNVEDEYFSAIEKRDTEILMRDKMLARQKTQLDEQKTQLDEQKTQLDEQKTQLDEQKTQLDEQKTQLDEQKMRLNTSIKLMLSQGIPAETIAKALGLSAEEVKSLKV